MNARSLFKQGRSMAARFRRAESGNVAVFFAIAILPMLALVGAAIDYARVNNARTALQTALDTAALMVSKDASIGTLTDDQVTKKAQAYFKALYNHPEAPVGPIDAKFTPNSGKGASIVLTGGGSMETDFMKVAGYPTINFGSSSTTSWGNTRMRVAMVLDSTGSMKDNNKMTKMRAAARDMVNALAALNRTPGDVYISLVPFAKNVNLGSGFNKNYIKWSSPAGTPDPDTWDENNGTCSGGTSYKTMSTCTSAYVCSDSRYTSKRQCEWSGKTWKSAKYVWTPANHSKWNGCVMDRDQDYDIKNTAPVAGDTNTTSTLFPAQEYTQGSTDYCKTGSGTYLQPIIPMTNDWSKLTDAIRDMDPTGGTNQAIGIAWGWQSLSTTNGPIAAPSKDSNSIYQEYLVILSDGLNTQNRWPSYGDGQRQSTCNGQPCIDARQKRLCDAIKAPPANGGNAIKIFTIQVNINKADPTSTVLQYCASPGDGNFQELTSENEIAGAFNNILTQIAKLRIAK